MASELQEDSTERALRKRTSLITGKREVDRDISWDTLFDEFERAKKAGGTHDSTLRSYKHDFATWKKFCEKEGISSPCLAKTRHVEEFLLEQLEAELSIHTRRNRGILLQSVLKFAHKRHYIASERMYGFEVVKAEDVDVYTPTLQEVKIIYDAIEHY